MMLSDGEEEEDNDDDDDDGIIMGSAHVRLWIISTHGFPIGIMGPCVSTHDALSTSGMQGVDT